MYQLINRVFFLSLYFHLSLFHPLTISLLCSQLSFCQYIGTSLSASFALFLSIALPVFRAPVNKLFKPHLLCSLITHAIFIHGCHSRRHKAIIPSLLSLPHLLIFAALLPTLLPTLIFLSPASIFSYFLSALPSFHPFNLLLCSHLHT